MSFLLGSDFTVESQFLESPGETQIGSRNWEFEKSRVREIRGEITSEANPGETGFGLRYQEVQETESSRNRDSTVFTSI